MKRLFLLVGLIGIALFARAQNPGISQSVEDLLEATGETMSDDSDIQEILDDWENLQENPLNVNTASMEDFRRLHLLSEVQINNLLAYRAKTGTIYSLYELVAVNGLNQDVLQKIEPFLTFEITEGELLKKRPSTEILARANRIFDASGQQSQSKYEGSPERFYLRMKHTSSEIEYGFVAEKDPGEAFFRKSNTHGFDYNSAFVNWGIGRNVRIFAGDYTVRFGQGLVAWQGFSMGKSVETTQVFRSAGGVRSYTSTDENQFFRGFATRIKHGDFTFSPFISLNKADASVDTIDNERYFGALQTSGYHRTNTEIANEKSLSQFAGGANLTVETGNWVFGGSILYNRFNAFMDRSDEPYNQFLPEGKSNLVGGIDWKGSLKKVFIFGEGAISQNQGRAIITGVMMNPAQNAELSLVYRNISKTYFSYFANAFTESSRVNDEHALYSGFKIYPASRLIFQAYADFFRFKWLKFTTAAPGNGTEFMAQLTYTPSRRTSYYLRFFQEEKEQRLIIGNQRYNAPQLVRKIRFNYSHYLTEELSLKGRAEFTVYSRQSTEKGFLLYQDIDYRPLRHTFSLNGRLAWFSTDGYNSRIYAFENDLLYSFAIPALYNKGIRTYIIFRKDIGRKMSLGMKLAVGRQLAQDKEDDSSENTTKTEIKFQIRYKL